jgi:ankyrin repeat protein
MSCLSDGRPEAGPRGQVAAARNPALLGLLKLPAGALAGEVSAALNKKNGYGSLPIHLALYDAATGPELVRAMLDAGGEAMLAVPGGHKRLPLHIAAWKSSSPAVVALLLTRGPAGASRAKDRWGGTPLYLAEEFNRDPGAAEIKALLRAAMQ